MSDEPSAEARAWGRKIAAGRPHWSDEKWQRIGVILGIEITSDTDDHPGSGQGVAA
uniref:hypothetical protein n=1 Tax=Nonomuraea pusilla TaxID=46177 RepID=UPI00159CBD02|nr:hypothetical protein [Nonomuraea pusilla]